jgi:hypothetical protein
VKHRRPLRRQDQTPEQVRERAEFQLKRRKEFAEDAPLAMQEYRAAEQPVRDRTASLRKQRLDREAATKGQAADRR